MSETESGRKHRVLQVVSPSRVGGAEMMVARMTPRLRARGHRIYVACNSGSRALDDFKRVLRDAERESFEAEHLEVEQGGGHGRDEPWDEVAALPIGGKVNLRAVAALRREAMRRDCDLLHSHLSTASWWCGWLDRFGLGKSVGHVHGFTSARWHRNQRHLIACSQAVKDDLIGQGLQARRITVLPNPVGIEDVRVRRSREDVRREMNAGSDAIVGCFGGLLEKKGWRDLLLAVPDMLRACPNTQFWCVGDGPLRSELEALVAEQGLNRVRFLGFRHDVADVMNAVDIMALPSHREPFGLVYVEAALLGVPSIGCRSGGAPEVIIDGETGLLVPPRDARALSDALVSLLEDREMARQMGRNARERALSSFGWESFLRGLETVYDELGVERR